LFVENIYATADKAIFLETVETIIIKEKNQITHETSGPLYYHVRIAYRNGSA
jgi:hypothetical protein